MGSKSVVREEFRLRRSGSRRLPPTYYSSRRSTMNADELGSSLRCTELLNDSPSTSRMTHREQRGRRSQRIALQPVGNTSHRRSHHGVEQWNHFDHRVISRKRTLMESRLNTAQHPSVSTLFDRQIGTDPRVLDSLKLAEVALTVNSHYFTAVQEHLQPVHREQAIDWLYDVSKEEHCEVDIFPLSVFLFDRFLSFHNILKEHIQALASVCLFLASKLKAPQPLNAQRMSYYTADSVSASEILNWEILLLSVLGWDLNAPTAFDFFDQMSARMPSLLFVKETFALVVHKMQKSAKLGMMVPSVQCALALVYACDKFAPLIADLEVLLPHTLCIDMMMLRGQLPQVVRLMTDDAPQMPTPVAPPTSCRTPSPTITGLQPTVPETPMNDSGFCSGVSSPESVGRQMDCSPPKFARLSA